MKQTFKKEFQDRNLEFNDDLEISKQAQAICQELNGSNFLPHCYHQIVSIAAVFCDDFGNFKKVGNFSSAGDTKEERESTLINAFFDYLNKHQPKLVSFNGRNFDIPTLLIRAMKYKISAHAYFEVDNIQLSKNKWENYRQRYSERFHTDLLDVLGNYGAARGLKLDVLANLVGFPGKFDVCGDQVLDLYYQKEYNKINSYCQSDVLNTYGVYLNYELLAGHLNLQDYQNILLHWRDKLPRDQEYYQIFFDTITQQIKT
ncbi:MAG: 3'-5' exonuclease [Helicobacter sp.]|nr:3'-5' exonuclease [Helicobacter sp.]